MEQPSAISAVIAFLIAAEVIISRGRIFFFTSSIICIPACLASSMREEYTAGIVPLPCKPIPNTSVKQFIEFAVYIPEHEPQVGQTFFSNSVKPFSSNLPAEYAPTASNILESERFLPPTFPASIGPPLTNTVGMFKRAAAIKSPGTFLSQLGIITSPSKPCASVIASVESAIKSRVTSEYFIPWCPIAIPSQTVIAGNIMGVPPAIATPSFTAWAILSKLICPGTISLYEETIPINGLACSSSVSPSA